MAEGWLWVSTLKQTSYSSSNRTTPALSLKTLTSQSRFRSRGRLEDRLLEQVVDRPALEVDPPRERLVRAVLAPGLGEGLELAVGGVAAELAEMAPGSARISARLSESWPDLLRPIERRVVQSADRAPRPAEVVGLALAEVVERQGADDGLLDGVVGQDPLDQPGEGVGRARRRGRSGSSGRWRPRSRGRGGRREALSASGSVTPGLGRTWTTAVPGARRRTTRRRAGRCSVSTTGSTSTVVGRAADVVGGQVALDEEAAAGGDRPGAGDPEFGGVGGDTPAFGVDSAGGGLDLQVPEHGRGSP